MSSRIEQPVESSEKLFGTEMLREEYRVMFEVEDNFWWYRVMRRNLFVLLQKHWDWKGHPSPRILDAGCGTGANLEQMRGGFGNQLKTREAWGLDVSADALLFSLKRGLAGRITQGSITEIPFDSSSFEIVTSFDVLNNLPDDSQGFREVSRVLRPGGLFIVNLPAYQFLFGKHDQAIGGRRRYNRGQIAQKLATAGMRVERSTYLNTFLFPPAAVVRLVNRGTRHADAHSDLTPPPAALNNLLTKIMSLEAEILQRTPLNLPFGLSVMTLARKI